MEAHDDTGTAKPPKGYENTTNNMMSEDQVKELLQREERKLIVYVGMVKKRDIKDATSGSMDVIFDGIDRSRAIIKMLRDILYPRNT